MITIDWESADSSVLLNPCLPHPLQQQIHEAIQRYAPLPSHIWLATSGSTASAYSIKMVALSKKAILCSAAAVNRHLAVDSEDCWLHVLPDFHVGGLGIWARSALSGASVIDCKQYPDWKNKWNPSLFYALACLHQVTLTALVPAQLYDLVQSNFTAPPSLRAVIVGGGALSDYILEQAAALNWKVLPSYGLSECASQVATALPNSVSPFSLHCLDHVSVKLEEDRLALRSDALLTGYLWVSPDGCHFQDPKLDGWFLTEDCAEIEGTILKIKGRIGDFIKIGGETCNFHFLEKKLEECKNILQIHTDTALIPQPDERLGHVVHLVCSTPWSPGLEDLKEAYNHAVLPYEKIRSIRCNTPIPRSPLGKVKKSELLINEL